MQRECPKCGFINPDATGAAAETCPKCTVVYNKAALVRAQYRLAEEQRSHHAQAPLSTTPGSLWNRFVWGFAALGAVAGLIQLCYTFAEATSAPQQAAGAGLALGMAVIPYCLARALTTPRD